MRIGFIGTGTMGNMMCSRIIAGGHQLTVFDLHREAAVNLLEAGAHWAKNPRQVAEASEVIFTSLPGPREVEEVVLASDNGILSGITPSTCYIDTTTNSPSSFLKIAQACRQRGAEVLDAPVSGRYPEMTIMVGGDTETHAKYRPLLECMAKHVFHVGESGKGMVAKLVTQYIGYTSRTATLEGMLLAAKAGVDLEILAEIIPVSAASRGFETFARSLIDRESMAARGGSSGIIAKDLDLACELARQLKVPATLGTIACDVYKRAEVLESGSPQRVLELMAGVQLLPSQSPAASKLP